MISEDKKRKAVELKMSGMSFEAVAKQLGISTHTVGRWYYRAIGSQPKKRPTKEERYNSITKYDRGTDEALHYAGWDDCKIAVEFGTTLEGLKKLRGDRGGFEEG